MDNPCPHTRLRTFALVLRDDEQRPEGVSVSVTCHECGVPFEFVAESSTTVLVSEDRKEIRVLIADPADTKKSGQAEA